MLLGIIKQRTMVRVLLQRRREAELREALTLLMDDDDRIDAAIAALRYLEPHYIPKALGDSKTGQLSRGRLGAARFGRAESTLVS